MSSFLLYNASDDIHSEDKESHRDVHFNKEKSNLIEHIVRTVLCAAVAPAVRLRF